MGSGQSSESLSDVHKESGEIRVYRSPPRLYGSCNTMNITVFIAKNSDNYENLEMFNQLAGTRSYNNYFAQMDNNLTNSLWDRIYELEQDIKRKRNMGNWEFQQWYDENVKIDTSSLNIGVNIKASSSAVVMNGIIMPVTVQESTTTNVSISKTTQGTSVSTSVKTSKKKKK